MMMVRRRRRGSSRVSTGGGRKFSIEDYIAFLDNDRDAQTLPVDHLHDLVGMHGFVRLKTKYEYSEALTSFPVPLLDPVRSTVAEDGRSAFPCARLAVEEVRADLKSIGWEECPVGSVLAVAGSSAGEKGCIASRPIVAVAAVWIGKRKRSARRTAVRLSSSIDG